MAMPNAASITINFDNHINKVVYSTAEWTTSGQEVRTAIVDGSTGKFTVTLDSGYVLDTVTLEDDFSEATLSDKTDTSFDLLFGNSNGGTITLTSKLGGGSSMSKSYDLSTSSKWASLSDGDHVVQLKAKGTGFGDSSFSNSVTVAKGSSMPNKGDIITLDSKQYRVLKVNGTVAEVLCMYDSTASQTFNVPENSNVYAGADIDTHCNDTFYGALSASIKSAIVDKTFTQDSWLKSFSIPTEEHYTGTYESGNYYLTLSNVAFGASITRHCYCLSVQDVLDYLDATTSMGTSDTTLTDTNIWQMFWGVSALQNSNIWLRSAYASSVDYAFRVGGYVGILVYDSVDSSGAVRPAFQVDLSKVEWTPAGDN